MENKINEIIERVKAGTLTIMETTEEAKSTIARMKAEAVKKELDKKYGKKSWRK